MVLKEEDNIIEITPNLEYGNKLISDELARRNTYERIHPTISDQLGSFIIREVKITNSNLPFRFMGGNDKSLHYDGEITELYNDLYGVVEKHKQYIPSLNLQTIDNLLFATLFSWGEFSERHGNDNKLSYLDELIGLYLNIKKKKVLIGKEASQLLDEEDRIKGFDRLSSDTKEHLIVDGYVKAEPRHVGGLGVNKLIYIPSDMDIVIVDRNGGEDIVIPEGLSNKIYSVVLKEIIEEHERNGTKFYTRLTKDDVNDIELESRSTFRRSKKNIKLLNYLILLMDSYITQYNSFEVVKKHRYVLIYDILKALRYIQYNHPTREDKYSYIRTVVRDSNPTKRSKTYGEKQFYM